MGLTEQLFGWCKIELNIYFFIYLNLNGVCKKAYLESIYHPYHKLISKLL